MSETFYRTRFLWLGVTLLFMVFTNYQMWVAVTLFDFDYRWHDSVHMLVEDTTYSLARGVLQPGDVVQTIDGQSARVGRLMAPAAEAQLFTVERAGQLTSLNVPVPVGANRIALVQRVPAALLSLALWSVGALSCAYARRGNATAIHFALVMFGLAVSVLGLNAHLIGVSSGWLGWGAIFFTAVGVVYLGFIPSNQSMSPRLQNLLRGLLILATVPTVLLITEVLVWLPRGTSFYLQSGVSVVRMGMAAISLAAISCIAILVLRWWRERDVIARGQIQTLLFFMFLGVMPVVALTFGPLLIVGRPILPFPFAINLLVLVPLGYFFVIFRTGYLGLDAVFGHVATLLMLATITVLGGFVALQGIKRVQVAQEFPFVAGALAVLPVFAAVGLVRYPVNERVRSILFGRVALADEAIPHIAAKLSSNPDLVTLRTILEDLIHELSIPRALLAIRDSSGTMRPVAAVNVADDMPAAVHLAPLENPLVRSTLGDATEPHPLMAQHEWIEMLVPIRIRRELIGYMALARPATEHFNLQHVTFMRRIGDMLAVGTEAIILFEASRRLSMELLAAQDDERQRLASEIHDEALHSLTHASGLLVGVLDDVRTPEQRQTLVEVADIIQETASGLRDICAGLYPPVIDQGVKWIVRDLAQQFGQQYGLTTVVTVDVQSNITPNSVSRACYRVLTEALNNVVRHAHATQATINVSQTASHLRLAIADDGVGFEQTSLIHSDLVRQRRFGLAGMQGWASLVNGRLSIRPNFPRGTQVLLDIPLSTS